MSICQRSCHCASRSLRPMAMRVRCLGDDPSTSALHAGERCQIALGERDGVHREDADVLIAAHIVGVHDGAVVVGPEVAVDRPPRGARYGARRGEIVDGRHMHVQDAVGRGAPGEEAAVVAQLHGGLVGVAEHGGARNERRHAPGGSACCAQAGCRDGARGQRQAHDGYVAAGGAGAGVALVPVLAPVRRSEARVLTCMLLSKAL